MAGLCSVTTYYFPPFFPLKCLVLRKTPPQRGRRMRGGYSQVLFLTNDSHGADKGRMCWCWLGCPAVHYNQDQHVTFQLEQEVFPYCLLLQGECHIPYSPSIISTLPYLLLDLVSPHFRCPPFSPKRAIPTWKFCSLPFSTQPCPLHPTPFHSGGCFWCPPF